MTDKKILHIISASVLAVLLIIFFIPLETAGRIIAAVVLLPTAVCSCLLIKKRGILSMNKQQILLIVSVISVLYLLLYYLCGIKVGFYSNPYALKIKFILAYFIPSAIIIVATEVYRWIIRAQDDRVADILCYITCVVGQMIICSTASVAVSSLNNFMELVAETMFPAIISNLLYGYIVKRYGFYPNIVYRAVTTLYVYLIPIKPALSKSLVAFFGLIIPIAIFLFIDSLYEKKVRYALEKKSKLTVPVTICAIAIMLFVIMVVSNQFVIGSYVIATESMTGELNKGDAAIYVKYDDQTITEGQVIAFEKDDRVVIHRVVDIQIINGQTRYFTKGDANEDVDTGFINDYNIIGLINFKIPFIGYPTLWMRSLFAR